MSRSTKCAASPRNLPSTTIRRRSSSTAKRPSNRLTSSRPFALLSKVTVPAIRLRMLSSLLNVSRELAAAVADGLGLALPEAMPLATTQKPKKPEIEKSPPLSLMALPGNGGVATRKVAIMIAEGTDAVSVSSIQGALTKAGAVTRYVGARLGPVNGATGVAVEAD